MHICSKTDRVPLLKSSFTSLQSVTGQKLTVLGETEINIDHIGPVQVIVITHMSNDMIVGMDTLMKGQASLNLHHNNMLWFNRTLPLTSHESNGIAGCSDTMLASGIPDVFSGPGEPLGSHKGTPLCILTSGSPIYQRPYRTPLTKRDLISKAVDDMLAENIIKPSCSPWASPVTLVPKKSGDVRFCVDFRQLNAMIRKDQYPLPRIDDICDLLQGSSVFSTLDLKSGYHQLSIDPRDTEKTAFICHRGQFEFLRVPLQPLVFFSVPLIAFLKTF